VAAYVSGVGHENNRYQGLLHTFKKRVLRHSCSTDAPKPGSSDPYWRPNGHSGHGPLPSWSRSFIVTPELPRAYHRLRQLAKPRSHAPLMSVAEVTQRSRRRLRLARRSRRDCAGVTTGLRSWTRARVHTAPHTSPWRV